jgi:oligo-1,6-glucosidase
MKNIEDLIIYQIYPSSFKDSDGDGWGDIRGVISKLDYLKELGINAIWFSPLYASPMDDMGYDISDYYKINPRFGTMEDFDLLLKEAKARGIGIVMDLVINHTSTEHTRFKKAIENPEGKYGKYYFIRKGKGEKNDIYPNNWQSVFGGTCWEPLPKNPGYYYMHLYAKTQADLDYHNPELVKEVEKIMEFYMKKGVVGFRVDAICNFFKSSLDDGKKKLLNRGSEYYISCPEGHAILKKLREDVIDKYDGFWVGETPWISEDDGKEYLNKEFDMIFEFDHISCDKDKFIPTIVKRFKGRMLKDPFFRWQDVLPWNAIYLENHDQHRSISRFIKKGYHELGAKALATILFTLKGTPFIYQGEEIGMSDYPSKIPFKMMNDVAAKNVYEMVLGYHLGKRIALKWADNINRDHSRTPFQWSSKDYGGFNDSGKCWLFFNPIYKSGVDASSEMSKDDGILAYYKRLIALRKEIEALKKGDFVALNSHKDVAAYLRNDGEDSYLVVVNLSNKKHRFRFSKKVKLVLSSYKGELLPFTLPPYFAGIYKVT